MDDREVLRHLTAVRVFVLELVAQAEPVSADGIARLWAESRPDLRSNARVDLPRMARQTLWRLENLGWIAGSSAGFTISDAGKRAQSISCRSRGQ